MNTYRMVKLNMQQVDTLLLFIERYAGWETYGVYEVLQEVKAEINPDPVDIDQLELELT